MRAVRSSFNSLGLIFNIHVSRMRVSCVMCVVCSRGIEDGGRRKGIDDACNNAGPDELKKLQVIDRSIDQV
jgi:hypothetical protein